MKDKIKWKKLKNIIHKISKKDIELILSTELDSGINAATNGKDIVINGNNIKSVEMVIEAIAHELVHIVDKFEEGSIEFSSKWNEYDKIIRKKYVSKL